MSRTKKGVVVSQERLLQGTAGDAEDSKGEFISVTVMLDENFPMRFELPAEEASEWYVGRKVKLKLQAD